MLEILLSLIISFTGVGRIVDPILVADAERRAHEIMVDFSHNGARYPEIIQWIEYFPEIGPEGTVRLAAERFRNSPSHWDIMSNPKYTRIGCAIITAETTYYIACSFGEPVVQLEPVRSVESTREPPVVVLPNTAMENPNGEERQILGTDIRES